LRRSVVKVAHEVKEEMRRLWRMARVNIGRRGEGVVKVFCG
jgi:hypothetical protein